ncbi:hypothetical protein CUC08_Gglean004409 [Alternaria sp. MG1]|nr:hypothetical protein CUC08_Gglean004409 [Alternaria sp. MG1]
MSSPRTHTLTPLATLTPPSNSRTWQSAPHPTLPIVATACSDRSVRVYSLTSFTLLHSITGGHKRSVRTVSWKPGTRGQSVLATGSFDSSAGIWRREEGGGAVGGMERDFTDAGDTGSDHDDADDYQFSCILDGHESEIKCLAWSPSGQYLATCSRDKSVWIWEELEDDNFETVAVLQEHDGDVKSVAWHPEEDLLVSTSYDDTVRLYREDADDWVQVAMIDGHKETVCWSRRTGLIVSAGSDGKIVVYKERWREQQAAPDTDNGDADKSLTEWVIIAELFSGHDVFEINHVCWARRADKGKRSEDEEVILSTGDDGEVRVWTLDDAAVPT